MGGRGSRCKVPQVAGGRANHNGQVAHELAHALRGPVWGVLNHEVQVEGALVCEALQHNAASRGTLGILVAVSARLVADWTLILSTRLS